MKKPQTPVRLIPTPEQFQNIVATIRSQRFTDHAHESADFVEFSDWRGWAKQRRLPSHGAMWIGNVSE